MFPTLPQEFAPAFTEAGLGQQETGMWAPEKHHTLALRPGVNPCISLSLSVPHLENGSQNTPLSKLDLWSAAFNVNLTYIYLKEDDRKSMSETF